MSAVKFKRFTKPQFLKQITREMTEQFFARFSQELSERQVVLPAASLEEKEYYEAVGQLAKLPDGLPPRMVEAMYAIADMADEDGEDRLEEAVGAAGLAYCFDENLTRAGKAMKAWLTNEMVFRRVHRETRAARVATMDYFTSKPENREFPWTVPDTRTVELMREDLEAEFQRRSRGKRTVRVELHRHDNEYWFTFRHGNTYARVMTVAGGEDGVIHFRPSEESLAVYNPDRDHLRIHANRKWQLDLFRRVIGERCFGDPDRFSERMQYTLQPLQTEKADSLDTGGIPELNRVVLRAVEIWYRGQHHDVAVRRSDDIFASAAERGVEAFPENARLMRATFEFYFEGDDKPRQVRIALPNKLKLARLCDAIVIHRWIAARGFCAVTEVEVQRNRTLQVQQVPIL